jgi:hypothetical protein
VLDGTLLSRYVAPHLILLQPKAGWGGGRPPGRAADFTNEGILRWGFRQGVFRIMNGFIVGAWVGSMHPPLLCPPPPSNFFMNFQHSSIFL